MGPDLPKQLAQPTEPAPRQVRITRTQLEQAARDYESGKTLKEIAAGLGITRSPLRRKLAAMGVAIRYQGLDAAGEQESVRLYRSGLSLVAVGDRLGVDHGTIHNTLRRLGEPTRDSHGRPR